MKVKVQKLTQTAAIPQRATKDSAAFDLSADIGTSVLIPPHTTLKIPTGLAFELPEGYFGAIYARSGIATKQGLIPANAVGICDKDYRGEYIVALHNNSDEQRIVEPQQRIAQLVIQPYLPCELEEVNELSETQRGSGGFGSTENKI